MRISVTVLVIITPIWKYRVIVLRPTPLWPPWPSQDSLAGCNPRLPYVFIQVFSNFCFNKQTFARNVAIRYVISDPRRGCYIVSSMFIFFFFFFSSFFFFFFRHDFVAAISLELSLVQTPD